MFGADCWVDRLLWGLFFRHSPHVQPKVLKPASENPLSAAHEPPSHGTPPHPRHKSHRLCPRQSAWGKRPGALEDLPINSLKAKLGFQVLSTPRVRSHIKVSCRRWSFAVSHCPQRRGRPPKATRNDARDCNQRGHWACRMCDHVPRKTKQPNKAPETRVLYLDGYSDSNYCSVPHP